MQTAWQLCDRLVDQGRAAARADLGVVVAGLASRMRDFPDARLGERVGQQRDPALGTGSTYYVMLHGAVQHNLYHAGQIALLRKFT